MMQQDWNDTKTAIFLDKVTWLQYVVRGKPVLNVEKHIYDVVDLAL